jgi:hypothetical protein
MTQQAMILIGVVALIASAIVVEAYMKRGRKRPLSFNHERRRSKVELGMEATDMTVVNAVSKLNDASLRKTGQGGSHVSWTETYSVGPEQMPDDETYAARYIGAHRDRN